MVGGRNPFHPPQINHLTQSRICGTPVMRVAVVVARGTGVPIFENARRKFRYILTNEFAAEVWGRARTAITILLHSVRELALPQSKFVVAALKEEAQSVMSLNSSTVRAGDSLLGSTP